MKILKGQDLIIRTSRGKKTYFFWRGAFWQILHREFHSESHFWVTGFQGFWAFLDWILGEMYPQKHIFFAVFFFKVNPVKYFFLKFLKLVKEQAVDCTCP